MSGFCQPFCWYVVCFSLMFLVSRTAVTPRPSGKGQSVVPRASPAPGRHHEEPRPVSAYAPRGPILGTECPALSSVAVALCSTSRLCALCSGLWNFGIWALPLLWALSSGLSSHPGTPASGLVVKVCCQDAAVLLLSSVTCSQTGHPHTDAPGRP